MFNKTLTVVVCLLAVSGSVLGEMMTVKFKDGSRPMTGTVKKIDGGKKYEIVVYLGGKPVMTKTVKVEDVLSMEKVTTPTEAYQKRLEKIDRNDAEARFKLGQWAFYEKMFKIAEHELEVTLKLKPKHEGAKLLLRQVKLEIAKGPVTPGGGTNGGGGTAVISAAERKLMITERDMNRIRLGELADAPDVRKSFLGQAISFRGLETTRVAFENKVLLRFIEFMKDDEDFRVNSKAAGDNFRRWKPQDQFAYIMDRVDRSDWGIKDDLIVKIDPASIKTFHREIWPMLAKSCGSSQCHGAPKGQGQLKLFNIKANDTVGLYSNFMILEMFRKGGKLINRDFPRESRLLEAALPRDEAKWKHPAKAKATPLFTGVKDRRYIATMKWVDSLKGPPRPNYGVTYSAPFGPDPSIADPLKTSKKPGTP